MSPEQPPCQALYIHIPFCLAKCPYCSFFSVAGKSPGLHTKYGKALRQQILQMADDLPKERVDLRTIFVGGGTPTTLAPDLLATVLADCLAHFPHTLPAEEMEISIEANPATVDLEGLLILRRAGFNRISIGAQSFDDKALRCLGRVHTAAETIRTVHLARQAGFININLDLMYGLPGQSPGNWEKSLHHALDLAPEHLALYELTVEENTPFASQFAQGTLKLPPEDAILAMLDTTAAMTRQAGLERYEISNYARPGLQCRHNLTYWHNQDYLGLGAGAVACLAGLRQQATTDLEKYISTIGKGQDIYVEQERLSREARFRETMIMGLRMTRGINIAHIRERFGIDPIVFYGETLARLIKMDLVQQPATHLRLTDRGLLLANQIMRELV